MNIKSILLNCNGPLGRWAYFKQSFLRSVPIALISIFVMYSIGFLPAGFTVFFGFFQSLLYLLLVIILFPLNVRRLIDLSNEEYPVVLVMGILVSCLIFVPLLGPIVALAMIFLPGQSFYSKNFKENQSAFLWQKYKNKLTGMLSD